jgi:hypothetical protein
VCDEVEHVLQEVSSRIGLLTRVGDDNASRAGQVRGAGHGDRLARAVLQPGRDHVQQAASLCVTKLAPQVCEQQP